MARLMTRQRKQNQYIYQLEGLFLMYPKVVTFMDQVRLILCIFDVYVVSVSLMCTHLLELLDKVDHTNALRVENVG